MRILIAAVGKLRQAPERDIIYTYLRRMRWTVTIREIDTPGRLDAAARKQRESMLLLDAIPDGSALIALDRRGQNLTSESLAGRIGGWRDIMVRTCTGEVWVRSSRPSVKKKVSCSSRAGCPWGRLSASKL